MIVMYILASRKEAHMFLLHFDGMRKVLIEAAQADNRKQGRFHAPPPPIEDPQLGLTFLHLRISIPSNPIQREIFSGNHHSIEYFPD